MEEGGEWKRQKQRQRHERKKITEPQGTKVCVGQREKRLREMKRGRAITEVEPRAPPWIISWLKEPTGRHGDLPEKVTTCAARMNPQRHVLASFSFYVLSPPFFVFHSPSAAALTHQTDAPSVRLRSLRRTKASFVFCLCFHKRR